MLTRTDSLLVAATLAVKVGLVVLGMVAVWSAFGSLPGPLEPWHRWDAPHYTDIAVFGYMAHDPGTLHMPGYEQAYPGDLDLYIVFFPLYPWLVAAVNAVIGAPVPAAFVVTTAASLFVAPILARLVAVDLGPRVGLRAGLLLLVFPTAFFLHIGYTESLFLALAFGSLWLARTDRWWLAGIAGGLAALTRINGLVLLPALAVEAYLQWREHRTLRVAWLSIGLVACGAIGYLALNLAVYGDPFAFSEIQRSHWFKELAPPWVGIGGMIEWARNPDPEVALMVGWAELLFTLLGLAATIVTALRFRPTWAAWMAGNWLLIVSTGFVVSVPRYALALFGIYACAAVIADRWRWAGWGIGAASLIAMVLLASRFAVGGWAF